MGAGAAAALGIGAPAAASAVARPPKFTAANGEVDWRAVREQFRLDPSVVNFSAFFLTSHPRVLREAIEHLGAQLDANPMDVYGLELPDGPTGYERVRTALAGFLGGAPDEFALTHNTTTGLGFVYNGLKVKPGQEFLLTEQDHVAHVGSAVLAGEKHGVTTRMGKLYENSANATVDEIASRLRAEIRPETRAVGVTWVQSTTGVRMPVAELAAVVAEANSGRAEEDRCLLVVDAVQGLAAVDADLPSLGADFVVAGTHKWFLGPRGTGLIWSPRDAWPHVRPTIVPVFREDTIANLTPGTFIQFDHLFAMPVAVDFHQRIGRAAAAERITQLSQQLKDGLRGVEKVVLHTPQDPAMSAGITCFEVEGVDAERVVQHLADRGLRISTAPGLRPYPRIGTSIVHFPEEVDRAVAALHEIA
ncbi:aminotransferase class V-fold PLP-dependent enzyme [Saccharopolyspora hirsuta]|uniref:aminotransferase class V-fold PLP-dependent enzyme n=1 Tax=Saccharopolyspora hirsuta TaxID=1837 RepID=UPI00332505AF